MEKKRINLANGGFINRSEITAVIIQEQISGNGWRAVIHFGKCAHREEFKNESEAVNFAKQFKGK